jgi:2-desacetyl-2-hydroxyethyl bacteriochlorophyllide A dehydrogenase
MKVAVYKARGQPLVLEDWPRPKPAAGQVLVRVKACGICGSDLHASQAQQTPCNIVMGHELGGVIAELGPDDTRWRVGQRVAPLSQISCGACTACLAGHYSECEQIEIVAFNPRFNGGYAEYVIVGSADILPLPDEVGFDEAAALEPLAVGLDAVRRARLTVNEVVLIAGAGPIGLTLAQWACFFGCAHVIVSEPNPRRRELALQMGATAAIDPSTTEDVGAAFRRLTGQQPSVIFEAVGVPGMIRRCIELAAPRTRLVIAGACQEPEIIDSFKCTLKALELIFPFGYSVEDYVFILELIRQRRIAAHPLISHHIPLEELPAMFEALRRPTDQIKVIVEP